MACKQCSIWYVKRVRDAVSHGTYDTFLIIESSSVRVPLGQLVVMLLSVHSGSAWLWASTLHFATDMHQKYIRKKRMWKNVNS